MISHKYQCIFIHIPKTGGSSIENLIWPDKSDRTVENLWMGHVSMYFNKYQTGGLQHLTARQIRTEVGKDIFSTYHKFTVIRNPWEKAISQFFYMKKRKDLRKFIGMNRFTSFNRYLNLIQRKEHVQWKKQIDFIVDDDGALLVDQIIRFEDLDQQFRQLASKINLSYDALPHANKTKRKPYPYYYNKAKVQKIQDIYSEDISSFDYSFEG